MEITYLTKDNENQWNDYVMNHPDGTFYHLIGWKKAIEKSYGHKPCYFIASENDKIVGILPLFLIKSKLFGTKLVSVPFANYGGILADSNEIEVLLLEKAKEILKETNAEYLESRDLKDKSYLFKDRKKRILSVLELGVSAEETLSKLPKYKRRNIRRTEGDNLVVEWNNDSPEIFYEIFIKNMKTLGSPVHSLKFYKILLEEYPDNAKILYVKKDNKYAFGAFLFYFKDTIFDIWSSALKEYKQYNVADFGIWNAIKYGIEKGFRYLDLGTSHENSGNLEFKRRWGVNFVDIHLNYVLNTRKTLPDLSEKNPKRQLFETLWRKVPISAARVIGPKIRSKI